MRLSLTLIVFCSITLPLLSQLTPDDEKKILDFMEKNSIPGLSIAIADQGEIIYAKGFGVSAENSTHEVNAQTVFQAASISKSFCSVLCAVYAERNELFLDSSISNYLSSWKLQSKFSSIPTVKQLLNHTGGINVHGFRGYHEETTPPTLEMILNGKGGSLNPKIKAKYSPGEKFDYSGGGYTIVQQALIDLKQSPFEEQVKNEIFKPFDLTSSFYTIKTPETQNFSLGHTQKGTIISGNFRRHPEYAAAGLWSTPSDLVKFLSQLQASLDKSESSVLSQKHMQNLIKRTNLNDSSKINYGLGFELDLSPESDEPSDFYHGGNNYGYTSFMHSHVSNHKSYAIMCNRDRVDLREIFFLIQDRIEFRKSE